MHAGVTKDEERVRLKRERAADFALSEKTRLEYEKIQPVTREKDDPIAKRHGN